MAMKAGSCPFRQPLLWIGAEIFSTLPRIPITRCVRNQRKFWNDSPFKRNRLRVCLKAPSFPRFHYNRIMTDPLIIAGREFRSRLIVGTGKYKSFQETARALEASGAEMVTVAVRRVNLDRSKESLLDYIDPKKYFLLPNTAGCYTADEAIRTARLGREVGLSDWVKLEVIGDQATLY